MECPCDISASFDAQNRDKQQEWMQGSAVSDGESQGWASNSMLMATFEFILMAPTSAAIPIHEEPVTFLNQFEAYQVRCRKSETFGDTPHRFRTVVSLCLENKKHRFQANELISAWRLRNPGKKFVEFDIPMCSNIKDVKYGMFSAEFTWDGTEPNTDVFLKFFVASTDFTLSNGEKGQPFRLVFQTFSHGSKDMLQQSSSQVQIYKLRGATRKRQTEREKAAKLGNQEQFQPAYDYTILLNTAFDYEVEDELRTESINCSPNISISNPISDIFIPSTSGNQSGPERRTSNLGNMQIEGPSNLSNMQISGSSNVSNMQIEGRSNLNNMQIERLPTSCANYTGGVTGVTDSSAYAKQLSVSNMQISGPSTLSNMQINDMSTACDSLNARVTGQSDGSGYGKHRSAMSNMQIEARRPSHIRARDDMITAQSIAKSPMTSRISVLSANSRPGAVLVDNGTQLSAVSGQTSNLHNVGTSNLHTVGTSNLHNVGTSNLHNIGSEDSQSAYAVHSNATTGQQDMEGSNKSVADSRENMSSSYISQRRELASHHGGGTTAQPGANSLGSSNSQTQLASNSQSITSGPGDLSGKSVQMGGKSVQMGGKSVQMGGKSVQITGSGVGNGMAVGSSVRENVRETSKSSELTQKVTRKRQHSMGRQEDGYSSRETSVEFDTKSRLRASSTATEVMEWLTAHRFGNYTRLFDHFDGEDLLRLNLEDLKSLIGNDSDALRLFNASRRKALEPQCVVYIAKENDDVYTRVALNDCTVEEVKTHLQQITDDVIDTVCVRGPKAIRVNLTDEVVSSWSGESIFRVCLKEGQCLLVPE